MSTICPLYILFRFFFLISLSTWLVLYSCVNTTVTEHVWPCQQDSMQLVLSSTLVMKIGDERGEGWSWLRVVLNGMSAHV